MRQRKVDRSETDPNYEVVWHLYNGICVEHRTHPATCIHELVPRSKAPHTWKQVSNRVTLCGEAHERAHRNTRESAIYLRRMADEFLEYLGRKLP